MTDTERILQAALDANPYDFACRCALADYLIEIGDERGEGYRALAELERVPYQHTRTTGETYYAWYKYDMTGNSRHCLESDWQEQYPVFWAHPTRQTAYDYAALGWLKLTQEQRDFVYRTFYRGAK